MNLLHRFAEHADWYDWPLRSLWSRLLAWCDRRWAPDPFETYRADLANLESEMERISAITEFDLGAEVTGRSAAATVFAPNRLDAYARFIADHPPKRCWTSEEMTALAAKHGIDVRGCRITGMEMSAPIDEAIIVEGLRSLAAIPRDDGRPQRKKRR